MFHLQLSETNNHLARDTINHRPVYNISHMWPGLDLGGFGGEGYGMTRLDIKEGVISDSIL